MPGFLTHYIAGRTLLNTVSPEIQEFIKPSEQIYNIGTQGPDIFFYYVPGLLRKRSRGVGSLMHLCDLGPFLVQMARLAATFEDIEEKKIIFSYISGFIMHYMLDANAHPYVYARTHKNNVPKIHNSAEHRKFETALDVAMLKLFSGEKPADYSQWTLINAPQKEMLVVSTVMSQALMGIYGRNVLSKEIYKAMRYMVQFTKLLQSRNGRRKRWMEITENLTIGEALYSSMVHMQTLTEAEQHNFLNTQKEQWQSPWESSQVYSDSFVERYELAVKEGTEMVETLYKFLFVDNTTSLDVFGNRSLKTGLTCSM